jgi:hypothetical protein
VGKPDPTEPRKEADRPAKKDDVKPNKAKGGEDYNVLDRLNDKAKKKGPSKGKD